MHTCNFFLSFGTTFFLLFSVIFTCTKNGLSASSIQLSGKRTTTVTVPGKRGLAYHNITPTKYFDAGSEITWAYNYGSQSDGLQSFKYVPMLYDAKAATLTSWDTDVTTAIEAGSLSLLTFNEPDQTISVGGTDIDPAIAASIYIRHVQPYAGKIALGSPAISQKDQKLEWLSRFMVSCTDCTIDFLAIHYYASTLDVTAATSDMARWISNAYSLFQRPIWITELGVLPVATQEQSSDIMKAMLDWLDNQDYVVRYAWYYCADGYLLSEAGRSQSGDTYVSYLASNLTGQARSSASTSTLPTTTTSTLPTISVPTSAASPLDPPWIFSITSTRRLKHAFSTRLDGLEQGFTDAMRNLEQLRLNAFGRRDSLVQQNGTMTKAVSCNLALQSWSQLYRTIVTTMTSDVEESTTYIPPVNAGPYTTLCDGSVTLQSTLLSELTNVKSQISSCTWISNLELHHERYQLRGDYHNRLLRCPFCTLFTTLQRLLKSMGGLVQRHELF